MKVVREAEFVAEGIDGCPSRAHLPCPARKK